MKRLLVGFWNSPSLTTAGSLTVRLVGVAVTLPVALRVLPPAEVNLWLIFSTIVGVLALVDMGFTPTFVRAIAYERGRDREGRDVADGLCQVVRTMRVIYGRMGLGVLLLGAVAGTLLLLRPIGRSGDETLAWFCWAVVVATAAMSIWFGMFAAYLQGAERIPQFRRFEMAIGIATHIVAAGSLLAGGGLLTLVLVTQVGLLVRGLANRRLALQDARAVLWASEPALDRKVFDRVWPAAWRSGVGAAMSVGTVQGTGLIYAQLGEPAEVAAYLLALRLIQSADQLANVFFYVRIPTLAKLYMQGRTDSLVRITRRSTLIVTWLLASATALAGFLGQPVLDALGSATPFPDADLWYVLGLGHLVHRIGAIYLQLHTLTNKVYWHIANGIAGMLILGSMPNLYWYFGPVGLASSILLAYSVFYTPFCITVAMREFHLKPAGVEFLSMVLPVAWIVVLLWRS